MALIKPYFLCRTAGKRREDDRCNISSIIHVLQSGCRGQDCSSEYGPMVYNRYIRWSQKGVWQYRFAELTAALAPMLALGMQAPWKIEREIDELGKNSAVSGYPYPGRHPHR